MPQKVTKNNSERGAGSKGELSSGRLALILAAVFVVVVIAGVAIPLVIGQRRANESPTPAAVVAATPTLASATAALVRSTPGSPDSPLITVVSPAGDVPTPTPNWDKLYASLEPAGWELLVLETGDTWGYLRPCG